MRSAVRGVERRAAGVEARELSQLATFVVGANRYAIDIMRIKEIIQPLPVVRVPRAPRFIEGVIELRGAILPVVDMRKRFELEPTPLGRLSKYVIVAIEGLDRSGPVDKGGRWIVGLVVDGVEDVIRVAREEIRAAPTMAIGDSARYFSGVARWRDRMVMILELDALLSSQERLNLAGLGGDGVPRGGLVPPTTAPPTTPPPKGSLP
jgi:purine-binding chemotaxis protein CheW